MFSFYFNHIRQVSKLKSKVWKHIVLLKIRQALSQTELSSNTTYRNPELVLLQNDKYYSYINEFV